MAALRVLLSFCCLSLTFKISPLSAAGTDQTIIPGAKGEDVVDAVVDIIHQQCIFNDDKYFLRRLAFVESRDGNNGNTYRPGYNGGIWQVDEDKFDQTKTSYYSTKHFYQIESKMNINWRTVSWNDLRKPIYSGLAARLYLEVMMKGHDLPRDIDQQASVWNTNYHDSSPPLTSNYTATASLLNINCTAAMDVVFILDSSGSINIQDYNKSKEFVVQWIEAFDIGPDDTQVAVLTYSTEVYGFYFTNFTTKQELIPAVRGLFYSGGGTNTALAIDTAVGAIFNEDSGARRSVPKAAILVTDGQSNRPVDTTAAAARARKSGITMYAVGVGSNVDESELNSVASDPDCRHVFRLTGFYEMEDFLQQMQEISCKTNIQVTPGSNATGNGEKIKCKLADGCGVGVAIPHTNNTGGGEETTAVVTTVNCGSATIYAAYNNPNPGAAYYEVKAVATQGSPAVIYLDDSGKTLYISIKGKSYHLVGQDESIVCEAVTEVKTGSEVPTKGVEVVCVEGGAERDCKAEDLIDFKEDLCKNLTWEFPNPCNRDSLLSGIFKHADPHHLDRYIMCDYAGNMYIVQCPYGLFYHPDTQTCGTGAGHPGSAETSRTPLNSNYTNPCTVEAIWERHYYFAYIPDNTKFIECDLWGQGWLLNCPGDFIWDPKDQRCVVKAAEVHVQGPGPLEPDVTNPCTSENIQAGKLFFAYPRASDRYIQCDVWGDAFVMMCFAGGHWNTVANACTAGGMT